MKTARKIRARLLAVATATLIALSAGLTATAPPASAATPATISGSGSTWAHPAIHAWTSNLAQLGVPVREIRERVGDLPEARRDPSSR